MPGCGTEFGFGVGLSLKGEVGSPFGWLLDFDMAVGSLVNWFWHTDLVTVAVAVCCLRTWPWGFSTIVVDLPSWRLSSIPRLCGFSCHRFRMG